MKPYSALITLWPCHSLEDFPVHYRAEDAASLLASWTALWHPQLIATTGRIPEWKRCDGTTESWAGSLITVPIPSERQIEPAIIERISNEATLIRSAVTKQQVLEPALGTDLARWKTTPRLANLQQKFFALGYAWLQIQLMTRQLRYSSNLDQEQWGERVQAAAVHALAEEFELAEQRIVSAFDLLLEEKNRYYPVVANFIDLTMLFPNCHQALRKQLQFDQRQNILATGSDIEKNIAPWPELVEKVRDLAGRYRLELVGGIAQELPDELLDPLSVIGNLIEGKRLAFEKLGTNPKIFGRRSAGLHPGLPQWLSRLGFSGAVHIAFDGEKIPLSSAPLFSWQSPDGSQISAIGGKLLDANKAESFLRLGILIGEQIDSYHTATVIFAHWPDDYCEVFLDLITANEYSELLGRFQLVGDVFESFYNPGYGESNSYDDYQIPHLSRLVEKGAVDPISHFIRFWEKVPKVRAIRFCTAMTEAITQVPHPDRAEFAELRTEIWKQFDLERPPFNDEKIDRLAAKAVCDLARAVGKIPIDLSEQGKPKAQGFLAINASNHRARIQIPSTNGTSMIDLPGLGFAAGPIQPAEKVGSRAAPPMIHDGYLRNDFFSVDMDTSSGGIRSVKRYVARAKNIFSQQIALRTLADTSGDESAAVAYSQMVADDVTFAMEDQFTAVCNSIGRLVLNTAIVARFKQTTRIRRGFPDIELGIEIVPEISLPPRPWKHYFANRIAWLNEGARRLRQIHGGLHPCYLERFSAPQEILIDDVDESFVIDSSGIPFHRLSSLRMLDSLLIVHGETQRQFKISMRIAGGGLLEQPIMHSSKEMVGIESLENAVTERSKLLKLAPNCLEILDTESLLENNCVIGLKFLVVEKYNEAGTFSVSGPRDFIKGHAVDLEGKFLHDIEVKDGKAQGSFRGFQVLSLHLYW